jgi:ribosomal protein L11 methyltransferase
LCLEWLEERGEEKRGAPGASVLDVGTGSGILAVGAALLGCGQVVAVDVDPEAALAAGENVKLNRMENIIGVHVGSAADIGERFDLVVANIQMHPLIEMAGVLRARVRDDGALALSGILVEQRVAVQAAYENEGMLLRRTKFDGEWCLLEFEPGKGAERR